MTNIHINFNILVLGSDGAKQNQHDRDRQAMRACPDSYCGAIRSLIRLTGAKTRLSFHAAKLALAFASMSNFQQDNGAI